MIIVTKNPIVIIILVIKIAINKENAKLIRLMFSVRSPLFESSSVTFRWGDVRLVSSWKIRVLWAISSGRNGSCFRNELFRPVKDLRLLRRQGDLVQSCLLPYLTRPLYEYVEFFQVRYINFAYAQAGKPEEWARKNYRSSSYLRLNLINLASYWVYLADFHSSCLKSPIKQ